MKTNRLDWTIEQKSQWIATYKDGTILVARSRSLLNSEINKFEKELDGVSNSKLDSPQFNLIFRTPLGTDYRQIPCEGKKSPNLNEVRRIARTIQGARYDGFAII